MRLYSLWLAGILSLAAGCGGAAAQTLIATGSGVVINGNTVLTNRHVLKGCASIRAHNDFFQLMTANLSASTDDNLDLGIAVFPADSFKSFVRIDARNLALGDAIYTLSYPLGYSMSDRIKYTSGEITSFGNSVGFIHDAIIDQGSSGSGVFDKDSNALIGINTQIYKKNAVYAEAIRALSVKYFLDLNNIPYNAAAAAPSRDSNIAATVFIDCFGAPQQQAAPQQPQKPPLWRCQITGRQSARTGRFYTLPPERQNTIIYQLDVAAKKVTTYDKTGTTAEYYVANFNFLRPDQNDGVHYRLTMDFSGYALLSLRFAGMPDSPDFNVGEYYDSQAFFGVCSVVTP